MFGGPAGSTSRLAKAAGAEPSGQIGDEQLHAVVARSIFGSQNVRNTSASDGPTFGSGDVEKAHAIVTQSTFGSQNVKTHHAIPCPLLDVSDVVVRGGRKGSCTLSKVSKT